MITLSPRDGKVPRCANSYQLSRSKHIERIAARSPRTQSRRAFQLLNDNGTIADVMNSALNSEIETQLDSPELISDPYPLLRRLREEEPVYWSDAIGGWIMTRYDDIVVSFKQTGHFSNENRLGQALLYLPPEKRANYRPFADHYATKSLLDSDPPEHT